MKMETRNNFYVPLFQQAKHVKTVALQITELYGELFLLF